MRILNKFLLLSILLTFRAHAGTGDGTVGNLIVGHSGNQVFVEVVGQRASFPCATIHPNFSFALLTTNPGGKEILSTLLAAKASGQRLIVVGTGSCNIETRMEDISYVWLY